MNQVFLIFRNYDFEGDAVMSAWTTRELAVAEFGRIHDKLRRQFGTVNTPELTPEDTVFSAGSVTYRLIPVALDVSEADAVAAATEVKP